MVEKFLACEPAVFIDDFECGEIIGDELSRSDRKKPCFVACGTGVNERGAKLFEKAEKLGLVCDKYIYDWANKSAEMTFTDDDFYFVHRGKLDIFNFSRKPDGGNENILANFKKAFEFRKNNLELITQGDFLELKTDNEKVFAYLRSSTDKNEAVLVIGNLDFKKPQSKIILSIPNLKKKAKFETITGNTNFKVRNKKIFTELEAGEIKVLKIVRKDNI